MAISLTCKVKASSGAFSSAVDDDLILFDPESGSYFGSGPVGARVWKLIENEALVTDVCATLMQEFDVERTICEREVLTFLSELERRGLVDVV